MSYAELLLYLIQNSLIAIVPLKPIQPPYLKNYNPDAKCEYHDTRLDQHKIVELSRRMARTQAIIRFQIMKAR
ncbi:hypothetical protein CR513_11464, partial [Mucuna pruriens]